MKSTDEMKIKERAIMKAAIIPFKPYLTFQEAMLYTNKERSTLFTMLQEFGIFKTEKGYYNREDIDSMMAGERSLLERKSAKIKI